MYSGTLGTLDPDAVPTLHPTVNVLKIQSCTISYLYNKYVKSWKETSKTQSQIADSKKCLDLDLPQAHPGPRPSSAQANSPY